MGVRRRDVLDPQAGEAELVGEAFETVARGIVERAGDVIASRDGGQGVHWMVSGTVKRGYLNHDGVEGGREDRGL